MTTMMLILAASAAALGLAALLRLPAAPWLVLSGVILSATGALPESALLQEVLLLGLAFLVFFAGTELNPQRVGGQKKAAVRVGVAQFLLVAGIGCAVALRLDFHWIQALYIGLAVTASSTLVVVDLLRQRRQFFEPFGRLVVGVLLLQDVLIILFISALSRVDDGARGVALALAGVAALVGVTWAWSRWVAPLLLLRLGLDEEGQLLVSLASLFFFLGMSRQLGQPLPAGAFLAGVSLSAFPVGGIVRSQMNSLFDFFQALFFVVLGALLVIPQTAALWLAAALALLVLTLTPPLVALIARGAGLSARTGIESGLLLAQCSEFSLVLALVGVGQAHIESGLLGVIALVTVATMMLTPFLATDRMTWRLMHWHPFQRGVRLASPPSNHVLLLGCGPNTRQLLNYLVANNLHIVVVDDDAVVVEQLREQNIEAVRGDGADHNLLQAVGARQARVIISTMRRVPDSERVIRFARGVKVVVRVFSPEEAKRIESAGGIPVLYAAVASEDFLRWFDQEFTRSRVNRPSEDMQRAGQSSR